MNIIKNTIIGISGIIGLIPGYLILTGSILVPPIGDIKVLMTAIVEVACFLTIGLMLFNRGFFARLKMTVVNGMAITAFVLFLAGIITYSVYLDQLVVHTHRHPVLIPLTYGETVQTNIDNFGSMSEFVRTDVHSAQEIFMDEDESRVGMVKSKLVLLTLFTVSICLLVFDTMLISLRIKPDPEVG